MGNEPENPILVPPPLPPAESGGPLRAFVLAALAAGAALGALHATRVDRWLGQLERPGIGRAALIEALARTDDPRVGPAFARDFVRDPEELALLLPELVRRKPPVTDELADTLLAVYARNDSAEENCLALGQSFDDAAKARIRGRAESSTEPNVRFGGLLFVCAIGGGKPADVAPILSAIEAESPPPTEEEILRLALADEPTSAIESEFVPSSRHKAAVRAAIALGAPAVPEVLKGFHSRSRAVANLCALSLVQLDPAALVVHLEKLLDDWSDLGRLLGYAENVLARQEYLKERALALAQGKEATREVEAPSDDEVQQARQILGTSNHLSFLVAEGLQAVKSLHGDEKVNLCFMRALPSHNAAVAKFCARELKARLDRDAFVTTLFKFLAHKESFNVKEVEVYEEALKSNGVGASKPIVENLERLLAEAGSARKVYWIHKAIALRCLESVGDEGAYPVLVKFASDPDGYRHVKTFTDQLGRVTKENEEVSYHSLCEKAAAAIAARTGKPAPELPAASGDAPEGE
jgi:hypothetical protein